MHPDANRRAADRIVESLQAHILSGRWEDAQTLPAERDLMTEFGVSRPVVREAIKQLASQGLVEARPRHRPIVRAPTFDAAMDAVGGIVARLLGESGGVRALFETRILVEAALVRDVARTATKSDLKRLTDALEENRAAVGNNTRFYETDVVFHRVFFQASGNPALLALHRAYVTWLAPKWVDMPPDPSRNQDNFNAHQAIVQAILMRDPDAAEAALRDHLDQAWDQVRGVLLDLT